MIELDHEDAGLDVEASVAAGKIAHVLTALLSSMRLEAIGGPMAREANRVAALLDRDRVEAERESERQAAIIQVAEGLTVNIGNTVVEPTPEWFSKGESRPMQIDTERWTEKPLSTVRRVVTSHAERAFNAGRITSRQAKACEWYREQHELSGLAGNLPSTSFEPRIAGTVNSGSAFTPRQIDAQDELRNARLLVPMRLRAFFDKVVIGDVAITRAAKLVHAGRDALDSLRCCADRVADYIEYSTGKPV